VFFNNIDTDYKKTEVIELIEDKKEEVNIEIKEINN
jgi:hypothetical protein